jgi:hypothetical protein
MHAFKLDIMDGGSIFVESNVAKWQKHKNNILWA